MEMELQLQLQKHQAYYQTGNTRDVRLRLEALKKFETVLHRREGALLRAIGADLLKAPEEAYMMELGIVYSELRDAIKHLKRWGKPRRVLPSIAQFPGRGTVLRDPYGVVLILAPWNYPLQLNLVPLVAAIAAGNCAVVRPSSSAPKTAKAIAALIEESFVPEHVSSVQGDSDVAALLTAMPFDKIFFTGSAAVGREVMKAASGNLTPVTLELGGKSPAIVAADADIGLAARRIVWGKFANAGQTCVAPDYVLVNRKVLNALLESMRKEVERQYGPDPVHNKDLTAIVNDRHFARLANMLSNGERICGGQTDPTKRRIAPTILTGITEDDPLMRDEIFGPILPVLTFRTMEQALGIIRSRPHPLALYLFTEDKDAARRVMRDMAFGGGCVNDTVLHVASNRLPFGGVGESGIGAYHGKFGYECFTRPKGVFTASTRIDVPVRYPPLSGKMKLLKRVMK